jgi:DNA repair exonuclease SbcCD nuclease subunit
MLKHKISTIYQLGDLFDSRKFTNHAIFKEWQDRFFNKLKVYNFKLITLLGNHDLSYKNSLKVNSPELFLSTYDNIEIISTPTVKTIGSTEFLLIPWICEENEKLTDSIIEETTAIYCAGHFELAGFPMQKGVEAHGEMSVSKFEKFDLVLSGHYHTRSKKQNILYTGIPFELTWADYDDQKGFHVYSPTKNNFTFVKTKSTLFNKFEYDDEIEKPVIPDNLTDTYVKVVVINKTNPSYFEKFISGISEQFPADLKITDFDIDFESVEIDDTDIMEDTKSMIGKFIDQLEVEVEKEELKSQMNTLYISALEVTI